MTNTTRSTQFDGLNRHHVNMAMAMEAHGITFSHLIPPAGDRLPAPGPWGKVLHRKNRRGSVRVVLPDHRHRF